VRDNDVETEVVNGGMLGEHQGINLPGAVVSIPSLTSKDEADLAFGVKNGVDLIAVSFVRTADDIRAAKKLLFDAGAETPIIAKLEKPQAIDNLEDILDVADGVMVARGDLGVEMAPEKVPIMQKHIIQRASEWRKPVITATQMLESMVENPRPTRAEASDVANAIFDGTDAVMLSAESASGKYPRESVQIMARIIVETEQHMLRLRGAQRRERRPLSISETICESIAHAAQDLEMRAIAVFTETGRTARLISKYRPKAGIYGFTQNRTVCNRLNLFWGVRPICSNPAVSADDMVRVAEQTLLDRGIVQPGDVVGVVAGTQMASGSTNFMRLHTVGAPSTSDHRAAKERRRAMRERPKPERRRR
jgi:pyruvate kinase